MNNEEPKKETKLDRAIKGYDFIKQQCGEEMANKILEMNKDLIKETLEEEQKESK